MKIYVANVAFFASSLPLVGALQAVTLTATFRQPSVTYGVPIVVRLSFVNATSKLEAIDLGRDRIQNVSMDATSSTGEHFHSHWKVHDGLSRGGRIRLMPGEQKTVQIILSDAGLNLNTGRYIVHFHIDQGERPGTDVANISNADATLIILPRDESSLVSACEDAQREFLNANDASEALDAVVLLQKFKDHATQSCLIKAYSSSNIYASKGLLLHSIAQVDDTQTQDFLKSVAQGGNSEEAIFAKQRVKR